MATNSLSGGSLSAVALTFIKSLSLPFHLSLSVCETTFTSVWQTPLCSEVISLNTDYTKLLTAISCPKGGSEGITQWQCSKKVSIFHRAAAYCWALTLYQTRGHLFTFSLIERSYFNFSNLDIELQHLKQTHPNAEIHRLKKGLSKSVGHLFPYLSHIFKSKAQSEAMN